MPPGFVMRESSRSHAICMDSSRCVRTDIPYTRSNIASSYGKGGIGALMENAAKSMFALHQSIAGGLMSHPYNFARVLASLNHRIMRAGPHPKSKMRVHSYKVVPTE